jgi:hypothetical protein
MKSEGKRAIIAGPLDMFDLPLELLEQHRVPSEKVPEYQTRMKKWIGDHQGGPHQIGDGVVGYSPLGVSVTVIISE